MKIFPRVLAGIVLLIVVAIAGLYLWGQPIQQIPGKRLRGNVVTRPIDDWSFVNTAGLCEIEVNPERPHSATVGCYGSEKNLYVSHDLIPNARKSWAEMLVENTNARVKFGDKIYPVNATRMFDRAERLKIAQDRRNARPRRSPSLMGRIINKIQNTGPAPTATSAANGGARDPVPDSLWMFKLESR